MSSSLFAELFLLKLSLSVAASHLALCDVFASNGIDRRKALAKGISRWQALQTGVRLNEQNLKTLENILLPHFEGFELESL